MAAAVRPTSCGRSMHKGFALGVVVGVCSTLGLLIYASSRREFAAGPRPVPE